ncbi:hypothetical protein AVEN_144324-1 [Araneus ventricosus]|uniref:ribonuclease H n=1 Tax=Araneus ventricosus TaxID=182803 RepID=A0A4Y2J6X7_ARAVE|nr:hypothetical protein AVEN_144324-1 [Araneus ventricosus]
MPLIAITKCYTTISNQALQVLSGCAPLDLKIELEIEVAKQIKIIKKEEIYEGFQNFDCEELMKPWDTISIGWIYFESPDTGHEIYTDGSKINNQVGAAYVYYYNGTETACLIRLGNQNTVFMAEVMAISSSIDYCIDKNIRNSKVIIDSRSTLMAIKSTEEKRRIIIETKKKLKLTKIHFQWVRAHNGTVGNERADALAKLAASKDQIYTEFGPSEAQVRYSGKVLLATKWQERWNNSAKGSWTKKFFKEAKFNRLHGDFYYNQVLTSHGVFGAHQERLFGKEGACPCGEQLETIEHILLKCKIWGKERDDWSKIWLQKDISDLVFYSPFKKSATDILKKLMSSRLTS